MTKPYPWRRLDRIEAPVPRVGTLTTDGGLYLNQDERRWFTELMERIELLHLREPIYGSDEHASRYASEVAQAARGKLSDAISKRSLNEVGFEGDPETSRPVARVQMVIINRGMPRPPMRGYHLKTVEILNMAWDPK